MAWTIQQAREVYNIGHWSSGYFHVGLRGHLEVRPRRAADQGIVDLYALTRELQEAGLALPVLVRFNDILQDRVQTLCRAFSEARAALAYRGCYTAVYPIKVNQQRSVVEQIQAGGGYCVGLEAGSKPELMAVMALSRRGGVIICNGYKDREYIRLALIGRRLGHQVYLVVEKLSDLGLIMEVAHELDIRPLLGVRVRLASIGAGKWQNTGGEKSKFGLSTGQILSAVAQLRTAGLLDCLELLHFHMGSQIANIRDIQRGLREGSRCYAELRRLGAPVSCVDVGGGLGVDYEGGHSRSACSMNYSLEEYAHNVVHALWEICAEQGLPQPDIITESGRAMTAHHAVLVTNVIDSETLADGEPPAPEENEPLILRDLYQGLVRLSERSAIEAYHDAAHWLSEAQDMFTHGVLSLEQRARAEALYFTTCQRVRPLLKPYTRAHREILDELNEKLADKYFCNFSLFQSLPDVWAIDQIFPIMPLHRLDEEPLRRAILQDLTCDSDGRIDYYVERETIESTLPVHGLKANEPYLLGMFLVGAYQEILGDMHNLFGDTDSVNLELLPSGGYRLVDPQRGDGVDDLLRYVHFRPEELLGIYRDKIRQASFSEAERERFTTTLEAGLHGYTYLKLDP